MASVALEGVWKEFDGGVVAVEDVSLAIADGEFLVLVGPSGCGKSTTLRMIAGLESPTRGTLRIGDRIVNSVQPKDRDIAMVFQNYALYPHMTVRENMGFSLRMRRMPRREVRRRVEAVASMLGLEELLERRPAALSGGQRQRVALGRAIVREPKAFLLDEPLSNLDARLRTTTRAELKRLRQRLATTTVYVTHDQEEAMTLGDRIAVMHRGRVQQIGPPLEVYGAPLNAFVGGFIGTPPMNMLPGVVAEADGGVCIEIDGSGQRVTLAPADGSALRARLGEAAVLGVRPQAFSEGAGTPGAALRVRVEVVEPLGESMDVFATIEGREDPPIVARLRARTGIGSGESLTLGLDAERLHVFEPGELGANLLAARRRG